MSTTSPNVPSLGVVVNSGTVNNTAVSCPSSEIDYTIYFKFVLFFLFVMASALVSGFSASARATRSLVQAVQDHRQCTHQGCTQDIEVQPSTSSVDEDDNTRAHAPKASPTGKTLVGGSSEWDSDFDVDSSHTLSLPLPPPPTRQGRCRKLWTKVQGALSDSPWPTLTLNTSSADVTATFMLNGPSSLLPR